jgi:hypothetical protein
MKGPEPSQGSAFGRRRGGVGRFCSLLTMEAGRASMVGATLAGTFLSDGAQKPRLR